MTFIFSSPSFAKKRYVFALFLLVIVGWGVAGSGPASTDGDGSGVARDPLQRVFPAAYFIDQARRLEVAYAQRPYWVPTREEALASATLREESLLLNNYILAYYGHPFSKTMGILGRYPKEELRQRLLKVAAEYREFSGSRDVRIAFYIIFGTAQPAGEIGYIREETLREWIEFAQEHDMLVFVDHQIGRFTPERAVRQMLPWLRYPNVHVALDPEWRTDRPMKEIGTVSAAELNDAQKMIEDYLVENNLPGERLLVVHQFNWRMISQPTHVDTRKFTRVRLVHNLSGIGTPTQKRDTYAFGARFVNMPVKGFKLWYDFGISGHTDKPMLTPKEVMDLSPRPYLIMYQ
ncbi:MAG: hypothetical protein FWD91_03395 [Treponema sp.]|nr:hypothetical protein [Treponema sp.]